jgi:hypothetical protein
MLLALGEGAFQYWLVNCSCKLSAWNWVYAITVTDFTTYNLCPDALTCNYQQCHFKHPNRLLPSLLAVHFLWFEASVVSLSLPVPMLLPAVGGQHSCWWFTSFLLLTALLLPCRCCRLLQQFPLAFLWPVLPAVGVQRSCLVAVYHVLPFAPLVLTGLLAPVLAACIPVYAPCVCRLRSLTSGSSWPSGWIRLECAPLGDTSMMNAGLYCDVHQPWHCIEDFLRRFGCTEQGAM